MFAAGQMQLPVRGQRTGVREALAAHFTLIRSLPGMLDVVTHQIQLPGVAFATFGALVRADLLGSIVFRVATVGGFLRGDCLVGGRCGKSVIY